MESAGHEPHTQKRRVLIISEIQPVPADQRIWQQASELVKNGYLVSVICPKAPGYEASYECVNGVHMYRHPVPMKANSTLFTHVMALFWEFMLAWKVFFLRGFDVIHACNPPDTLFLVGGYFKLCFRKKFLFDQRELSPERYEATFGRRDFYYKVIKLLEQRSFKLADVSLAANDSYRKLAIERGKMAAEHVFVVRSCPSLERVKAAASDFDIKMGRRHLVGYAGMMDQQAGIQYLIEATRIIIQDYQRQDVQFVLTGDGPALADLKKLAQSRGVAEYITFTGPVSDQARLEMLSASDICVNPEEVNPASDASTTNSIMEYMALGKPIVQFDVTEGRFTAQGASLYAKANDAKDLADQIVQLLNDPVQRDKMSKLGRTRIENELSWPQEAPKLLAAYNALFDHK